jgi:hypothetical protein
MRIGFVSSAACLVASFVFASACSSSGTPGPANGDTTGSQSDAGRDAMADATSHPTSADAALDVIPAGPATVRVANLSPDGGAIDFCVRIQTSLDFGSPKLASIGGSSSGLAYGQVTRYFPIDPGPSVVRLVAAGSKDCSNGLTSDLLADFEPQSTSTIAAEGELNVEGNDPIMAPYSYTDDASTPASGISLRFIHAASGLLIVDLGLGTQAGSTYQPVFSGVTFGTAGGAGNTPGLTVDANGYLQRAAFNAQTLSAHVDGKATDDATTSPVTIADGTLATMFLVGGKVGDTAHPVRFLLCDDGAPPVGGLAKCTFESP